MDIDLPLDVVGICHLCRHLDSSSQGQGWRCAAFSTGIPVEIRVGEVDHRRPVTGDNGIVFASIEPRP
jgi:hypothetical protein